MGGSRPLPDPCVHLWTSVPGVSASPLLIYHPRAASCACGLSAGYDIPRCPGGENWFAIEITPPLSVKRRGSFAIYSRDILNPSAVPIRLYPRNASYDHTGGETEEIGEKLGVSEIIYSS